MNKKKIMDSLVSTLIGKIITGLMGLGVLALGYFSDFRMRGWIAAGVCLVFLVITVIYICISQKKTKLKIESLQNENIEKSKKLPTFGVSAIVLNLKNEMLVLKPEEIFKQPGSKYDFLLGTDVDDLTDPYDKIIKCIENETDIPSGSFDYIGCAEYLTSEHPRHRKISTLAYWHEQGMRSYKEGRNLLTPPPFLIEIQKAQINQNVNASKIYDMFYIFKTSADIATSQRVAYEWVNQTQINEYTKKTAIYKDLFIIYNEALKYVELHDRLKADDSSCNSYLTREKNLLSIDDTIEKLLNELPFKDNKKIIAFDFDELIVPIHMTKEVTSVFCKVDTSKVFDPHDFNGLLYLDSLLIGVSYSKFNAHIKKVSESTNFRDGFKELLTKLQENNNVIVISSGIKDICKCKLCEIGFDEDFILAGELLDHNDKIFATARVVSCEDKGYIVNKLQDNGCKVISIGHSKGDSIMLNCSDVGIAHGSKDICAEHNTASIEELEEILLKNL